MRKMVFGLMFVGVLLIGANAFAAGDLIVNGKIGIGTTTPVTSLDVNGGIKVGNVTAACSASLNGVLRYSGTALEFCNGTAWVALGSGGGTGGDSYTKLLLHMDGTTTFTDSSASAHPVTANGNAQISTAQSKFGGASGYLDGSGDYLRIPDNGDFDFGTGDFTIDFWAQFNGTGDFSFVSGTLDGDLMIARLGDNTLGIGRSTVAWDSKSSAQTWTNGIWYHIAIVRSNSTLKMFKDGTEIFSGSNPNSYNVTSNFQIACRQNSAGSEAPGQYFNGYLDELRVSKGIARWTANFTPPTAPY